MPRPEGPAWIVRIRGRTRPRKRKPEGKTTVHEVVAVTRSLLEVVHASAEVCTPLKSVIGGLLKVGELIENFKGNEEKMVNLASQVQTLSRKLGDATQDAGGRPGLLKALSDLNKCVSEVHRGLEELTPQSKHKSNSKLMREKFGRFLKQRVYRERLDHFSTIFEDAGKNFVLGSMIRLEFATNALAADSRDVSRKLDAVMLGVDKRLEKFEKIQRGSAMIALVAISLASSFDKVSRLQRLNLFTRGNGHSSWSDPRPTSPWSSNS